MGSTCCLVRYVLQSSWNHNLFHSFDNYSSFIRYFLIYAILSYFRSCAVWQFVESFLMQRVNALCRKFKGKTDPNKPKDGKYGHTIKYSDILSSMLISGCLHHPKFRTSTQFHHLKRGRFTISSLRLGVWDVRISDLHQRKRGGVNSESRFVIVEVRIESIQKVVDQIQEEHWEWTAIAELISGMVNLSSGKRILFPNLCKS